MPTETLGQMVRHRRRQLNLTQQQLADAALRSQRWVSDLENNGVKRPHLDTLRGIATALRLDITDLIIAYGQADTENSAHKR